MIEYIFVVVLGDCDGWYVVVNWGDYDVYLKLKFVVYDMNFIVWIDWCSYSFDFFVLFLKVCFGNVYEMYWVSFVYLDIVVLDVFIVVCLVCL